MMRINPFRKFLTKENVFQESGVNWTRLQYPKCFITHHPNEGRRTPFERFLFKILGVKVGFPDIAIFDHSRGYCGLAIELKIKPNKPTPEQLQCLEDLKVRGWSTHVAYNIDQYMKIVNWYFNKN